MSSTAVSSLCRCSSSILRCPTGTRSTVSRVNASSGSACFDRPRMLLAVDVGNTQTHLGMFRDDDLVEHWRFATVRDATADELATVLVGLLALRKLSLDDVSGAVVSSVVPQLSHEWAELGARYLNDALQVIGPGVKTGIPIRTENPHETGPDRLVNAVAAYDRVGSACVVVDFGTTINNDIVSAAGELLGAIFTPGVEISIQALPPPGARPPPRAPPPAAPPPAADRDRGAERADRPDDRGCDPLGDRLR